jgi:hypothetical protein
MHSQRAAAPVVIVALVHAAACVAPPSIAPSDAGWNTARATVVSQSAAPSARIVIASGIAIRDDVSLRDGTIEADIDAPRASQFAGLAFRVASTADYEIVYFSAQAGRWGEVQYQPLFDGEPTWQLYPGSGYRAEIPATVTTTGAPMHVKIVFAGRRADVYLNRSGEPVLRVVELKRVPRAGRVAVWASGGEATSAAFANYSAVGRVESVPEPITMAPPQRGQLMRWRVSAWLPSPDSIVAPAELAPVHRLALRAGVDAEAETDGLMNLSRVVGNPAGPQLVNVPGGAGWGLALASATLEAREAHTTRLRFGYSEGIAIFLNGRRVFAGTHPYASPDLGRVIADANTVELPLARGANELVLAVTDRAFGWGFRARLDDETEATIGHP